MPDQNADVVFAGAGLASSLVALRLKSRRPDLRIVVLEEAASAADGHTWSYFTSDVGPVASRWLAELERRRWPEYLVRFPDYERELATPYASLEETRLQRALTDALGPDLRRGACVVEVAPQAVVLDGGETWRAPLVVDGRGARRSDALWLAWQKFRGVELKLQRPHGLERPVVMDARVPQLDGFRFLYLLPFDPQTLLVEDTRYSDGPDLDAGAVEAQALSYARANGWGAASVNRRETGVLPIALGGSIDDFWAEQAAGVPSIGMRAALFHPTTGYSLPDAVRLADQIASAPTLKSAPIRQHVEAQSKRLWAERGFYRALNRMMFLAAKPEERWRVLDRFYRLPGPLIERFYAGTSSWGDKVRLVAGKPPVPVGAAMSALSRKQPSRAGAHA